MTEVQGTSRVFWQHGRQGIFLCHVWESGFSGQHNQALRAQPTTGWEPGFRPDERQQGLEAGVGVRVRSMRVKPQRCRVWQAASGSLQQLARQGIAGSIRVAAVAGEFGYSSNAALASMVLRLFGGG